MSISTTHDDVNSDRNGIQLQSVWERAEFLKWSSRVKVLLKVFETHREIQYLLGVPTILLLARMFGDFAVWFGIFILIVVFYVRRTNERKTRMVELFSNTIEILNNEQKQGEITTEHISLVMLNQLMLQWWKNQAGRTLTQSLQNLEKGLNTSKPSFVKKITFGKFNTGGYAPEIVKFTSTQTVGNKVYVDFVAKYHGSAEFDFRVATQFQTIHFVVRDFRMIAKCKLTFVVKDLSMSAAVSITEDPVLDFSVSHAEMDLTITNVPMISEWVREQVIDALTNYLKWPRSFTLFDTAAEVLNANINNNNNNTTNTSNNNSNNSNNSAATRSLPNTTVNLHHSVTPNPTRRSDLVVDDFELMNPAPGAGLRQRSLSTETKEAIRQNAQTQSATSTNTTTTNTQTQSSQNPLTMSAGALSNSNNNTNNNNNATGQFKVPAKPAPARPTNSLNMDATLSNGGSGSKSTIPRTPSYGGQNLSAQVYKFEQMLEAQAKQQQARNEGFWPVPPPPPLPKQQDKQKLQQSAAGKPRKSLEEVLQKFGLTEKVVEFALHLSTNRDLFLKFPLDTYKDTWKMNPRQIKHAELILREAPQLNKLRSQLSPKYLEDNVFWYIYFELASNRIGKVLEDFSDAKSVELDWKELLDVLKSQKEQPKKKVQSKESPI